MMSNRLKVLISFIGLLFVTGLLFHEPLTQKWNSLLSRVDVFSISAWQEVFEPRIGREVLPEAVREINDHLINENIRTYDVSRKVRENIALYQRLLDGVYPAVYIQDSQYVITTTSENNQYTKGLGYKDEVTTGELILFKKTVE